jgi:hypothetical protein
VRKQGKIFLIIRGECSQCDCTMTTIGGSCGWLGPKGKDHTAAKKVQSGGGAPDKISYHGDHFTVNATI